MRRDGIRPQKRKSECQENPGNEREENTKKRLLCCPGDFLKLLLRQGFSPSFYTTNYTMKNGVCL